MKKRIISILLTTTLVSSLLVGCGKVQDPMMQMKKEEIINTILNFDILKNSENSYLHLEFASEKSFI